MFRILAITATLLGALSVAHADVWRYTDAQGRVQYSDKWVPGSVLIKTDKNHPSPAFSEQDRTAAVNDAVAEKQADAQAQATVQQDLSKVREKQCKDATTKYDKSITSRRIYREGAGGEREYLSDAEADAFRLRLLNERKEACGK